MRVAAAAPALAGYSAGSAANKNKTRLRIAVIGVGGRGMGVLKASLAIGGIDVAALCDIRREAVNRGADFVQTKLDYKPALFADGPDDYKRMLQRDDIDAVFVTTPTVFHGPMGAASLRAKKWVFSEVPACNTIEEGWDLINAAEESGKGYFMAENYCFMRHNLLVLNMVEKGVFKTFTFAECGYIHEARDLQFNPDGTLNWRGRLNSSAELIGNTYPTHALG
ncbi:MAG: Gfo/Idh/MocA family oxidoreductase, partial [Acidobacteriia bacterium]|nr:Gfo/Idh/MocA family oxidoreductase [Terriglobia bacterium]